MFRIKKYFSNNQEKLVIVSQKELVNISYIKVKSVLKLKFHSNLFCLTYTIKLLDV